MSEVLQAQLQAFSEQSLRGAEPAGRWLGRHRLWGSLLLFWSPHCPGHL